MTMPFDIFSSAINIKLKQLYWESVKQSLYSPDLEPSEYHLFLSPINQIRGEKIKEKKVVMEIRTFFNSKSKDLNAKSIYDLPRRWQEVIDTKGQYISKKQLIVFK